MKFQKFISLIFHPMVVPTLGVLIYFLLIPNVIKPYQQYSLLGLIFIATYIFPLLILLLLKILGLIKSFQLENIKERKIPLFLMILLFFILGKLLSFYTIFLDFSLLFYGTTLALFIIYMFSYSKIKVSLHLTSMGILVGFFILIGIKYSFSILPIILVSILLSGLVGSSRLYLKAHEPIEVYLGFLLGSLSPFFINYFL